MRATRLALVVVLLLVASFVVFVVLPNPAPAPNPSNPGSGSGNLAQLIAEVQLASGALKVANAQLAAAAAALTPAVQNTFAGADARVDITGPAGSRAALYQTNAQFAQALGTYAAEASTLDAVVQAWDPDTVEPGDILSAVATFGGIAADVTTPMAVLGVLASYVGNVACGWTDAYADAGLAMSPNMQALVRGLYADCDRFTATSALGASPWQAAAASVCSTYYALCTSLVGVTIPSPCAPPSPPSPPSQAAPAPPASCAACGA
jgi:hypothetical protein